MRSSKITVKYQTTIPKEIRKILKVRAGDQIVFEVLPKKTVVIRKARAFDAAYAKALRSTLSEWESEADEKAYRDL
jgi:antitoxin PrlF